MTLYTDDRPHPLGLTANPESDVVLTKRAELYLVERARRAEREPSGGGAFIAVVAVIAIACGLLSYLGGIVGAALS